MKRNLETVMVRYCLGIEQEGRFQFIFDEEKKNILTFQTIESVIAYIFQTYSKTEFETTPVFLLQTAFTVMFGKIVDTEILQCLPHDRFVLHLNQITQKEGNILWIKK